MPRATQKERLAFIRRLAEHCGNREKLDFFADITPAAEKLMRYGATYARIQVDYCNVPMDDAQQAKAEQKEARLEKRIAAVCEILGATPVFSGDPRGITVKIAVPDGWSNSFGGDGIIVPTA